MADLSFQARLAGDGAFQSRVHAALINAALAVVNEVVDEVQTLTVTGTPTGGNFTLASLPGSVVTNMVGTLSNAANTVTGLSSTVGLFVGMSVVGTNVPANATIATITSATALTLSANASGNGAQTLTFSGTPLTAVSHNHTASDVQASLQNLSNIGVNNVICGGGPLPGTPITIRFATNLGGRPHRLLTIGANGLTGGSSPAASLSRTTAGVAFPNHVARAVQAYRVLAGSYDLYRYAMAVAGNATVQGNFDVNLALTSDEATVANDIQFVVNGNWNAFNT